MDSEIMETAAATPLRREGGFTLVELLIVIVILGVLSTVAVFAVRGITDKGNTAACQADYKTLETGIEAYIAQGAPPRRSPRRCSLRGLRAGPRLIEVHRRLGHQHRARRPALHLRPRRPVS